MGEFADLSPMFRASLTTTVTIILGDRANTSASFDSEEGMQQGSGDGPAGFCLGMHADLVDADRQLAACGGCAKAEMDDTYLLGPIERVLPTAIRCAARLEERTGIRLNVDKSAIHSLAPARDQLFIESHPEFSGRFRIGRLENVDPQQHP